MKKEIYNSLTIEVNTPDGVLYCTICEIDNTPIKVMSTFGKKGTPLAAWAFAVDTLINMLLERNVSVNDIISNLSEIGGYSSVINSKTGTKTKSGPAGLVTAFLEYKRQKFHEFNDKLLKSSLGIEEDN